MPGAGKSRFSKEARANRDRYGKRERNNRRPLPVIVIVCDDAKTAPAYFNLLKRQVKEKLTLSIQHNPCDWASPAAIVKCAEGHLARLKDASSHDEDDYQAAWALIDLEEHPARQQLAWDSKRQGTHADISVALSNPCYEMWTLLHIVDTGEMFTNCNAVLARLESEWLRKFGQELGPKAQVDFGKIMPYIQQAISRARPHVEKEPRDPSWTEVYLLAEEILRIFQQV